MKAIVTGGAGFIGSGIASKLLSQGHEVHIIDILQPPQWLIHKGALFHKADITDAGSLPPLFSGAQAVFHEAAQVSVPDSVRNPQKTHRINVEGTRNVLEACRKSGVEKAILASSAAVYGNTASLPKTETDQLSPASPYGESKMQNETDARDYSERHGINAVCLRYFNVYGPMQKGDSGVIPRFMNLALAGKPPTIYGDGKQTRDFVFIDDVVEANLLCMEKSGLGGEVFNVGTGTETSLIGLWKTICSAMGKNISPIFEEEREGDISRSVACIEKARKHLGYEPAFSLEAGIKRTAEWMKRPLPLKRE